MDTNVFIAALTSADGTNRQVIRACLEGKAAPLMGAALFHEYEDLIVRRKTVCRCPLSEAQRDILLNSFFHRCEWIRIYFLWRPNLRDEADNHLVELAIAGGADAIISNNIRDLRSGELSFPFLKIFTPSQFLQQLP